MKLTTKSSNRLSFVCTAGLTLSVLGFGACDGLGLGDESVLPPADVFLIPAPDGSTGQGSGSSAICASGQDSYDELTAIIDEQNALADADIALMAEALDASPNSEGGVLIYQAEVDGRSLVIESVSSAEGSVFTGTLNEDGASEVVIEGVTRDGNSNDGVLTLSFPDTDEVEVVFSESETGRQVVRTQGDSDAVLDISETDVRLVVDDVVAWWSKEDYAGIVVGDDVSCFEGAAGSSDFCDIECSTDLITRVAGDVDLD